MIDEQDEDFYLGDPITPIDKVTPTAPTIWKAVFSDTDSNTKPIDDIEEDQSIDNMSSINDMDFTQDTDNVSSINDTDSTQTTVDTIAIDNIGENEPIDHTKSIINTESIDNTSHIKSITDIDQPNIVKELGFEEVEELLGLRLLTTASSSQQLMEDYLSCNINVFIVIGKDIGAKYTPRDYGNFTNRSSKWIHDIGNISSKALLDGKKRKTNLILAISVLKDTVANSNKWKAFCDKVRTNLIKNLYMRIGNKVVKGTFTLDDIGGLVQDAIKIGIINSKDESESLFRSRLKRIVKGVESKIDIEDSNIDQTYSKDRDTTQESPNTEGSIKEGDVPTRKHVAVEPYVEGEVLDFRRVEELLGLLDLKDEETKHDPAFMEEYLSDNINVFPVVGLELYEGYIEGLYGTLITKSNRWIQDMNRQLPTSNPHNARRRYNFNAAIQALKNVIRTDKRWEAFCDKVQAKLKIQLNASFDEKIRDGAFTIEDMASLVESAIRIKAIKNNKDSIKAFIDKLESVAKVKGCPIETVDVTLCRTILAKPKIERLDIDKVRQEVFTEYKRLKTIDAQLQKVDIEPDSLIQSQLDKLIKDKGLLVNNVEYYTNNFYNAEVSQGRYNFSLPIDSEYFYYLKGIATHLYGFTEEQWIQFVIDKNIKKETDSSIAFIMGGHKAISIVGIAKIISDNPLIAKQRIIAGDLSTYLYHIDQAQLAQDIEAIAQKGGDDIVEQVTSLLRKTDRRSTMNDKDTIEVKETKEGLLALLENKPSPYEIVDYIIAPTTEDGIFTKLLDNSEESSKLCQYLSDIGYSLDRILINVLMKLKLPERVYIYEIVAKGLLHRILKREDGKEVFNLVLKPILDNVKDILTTSFIKEYNDTL